MSVSSRVLAQWYVQVANSVEAGLSLERAIGAAAGPPALGRQALQERLREGDSIGEALERGGAWLPAVDRQLITAGAEAGRLPDVIRRLAHRHQEKARLAMAAVMAALYPAALGHVAILALPLAQVFQGGGVVAYATSVAQILVPLWLLLGLLLVGLRRRWPWIQRVVGLMPLVGGSRRATAIADLAGILEAQLTAGIRLDVAWLQAAMAAGDPRLEPVAVAAAEAVQRGQLVSPALREHRVLPAPFADFYANGEETGRLDHSLRYLEEEFLRRAQRRMQAAAVAYPAVLFALVALGIAVTVVRFWLSYFEQLNAFG